MAIEFRRVFDTIPEQFDKYRSRYCAPLFADLIQYAGVGEGSRVLELGPGTGQASEPILNTGCDYLAIELGEHMAAFMRKKFEARPNFHLVNDDFITHDFGDAAFDLIFSAATIQWIPEEIAFSKTFSLLKPGGTLAMMMTHGDYKTPNEALYHRIQAVYDAYFHPTEHYKGGFRYQNAVNYGFENFERREYRRVRAFRRTSMWPLPKRTATISRSPNRTGRSFLTASGRRSSTMADSSCPTKPTFST